MIDIKFDSSDNPVTPTMIIALKSGKRLGAIFAPQEFHLSGRMKTTDEFSFSVNKYLNNKINPCWYSLQNFRLIYCVEWDAWFQTSVSIDESDSSRKNVIASALCETELGQTMLYGVEINTEDDAIINDGKGAIIWDDNDPYSDTCIMWRVIKDKAPHYSIDHVDESLKKLNRTFTFDNKSIYDAFEEIANELNALVVYGNENITSDISLASSPKRTISLYDLEASCMDCNYRGEDGDDFNIHDKNKPDYMVCPKCGSHNIKMPFGEDTPVLISIDRLTDQIQFQTDVDAVKNCFHLVGGDDIMTAAILSCIPNGNPYIWYFSDEMKADMSDTLREKYNEYQIEYSFYENEKIYYDELLDDSEYPIIKDYALQYNECSLKYKEIYDNYFQKDEYVLEAVTRTIGYKELSVLYYDVMDFESFINYSMTPMYNYVNETTLDEQAEIVRNLTECSVGSIKYTTATSVKNTIQTLLKIYMDKAYKVDIDEVTADTFKDNGDGTGTFTSTFKVYAYADSDTVKNSKDQELVNNLVRIIPDKTIIVNEDYSEFMTQKIKKIIHDADTQNVGMMNLFDNDTEISDFEERIKWYSLTILSEIQNVGQTLSDLFATILPEQKENSTGLTEMQQKITDKLSLVESEIKVREQDVFTVQQFKKNIEYVIDSVRSSLDFQSFMTNDENGNAIWKEFCSFRRETEYKNDNYISDGHDTDNKWLISKATEFISRAEKEIYKSAMCQHSISTSLNNIFVIPQFKPFRKYFKLGNWMRAKVDDKIYKLRLLEYDIDFTNLEKSDVIFSDVKFVSTGISDVESILSKAQSMTTSYSAMQYQMLKNNKTTEQVNNWIENGLELTKTKIINNSDNSEIVFDKDSLLVREYDPVTGEYSPTQMKITHSSIIITNDNWKTAVTAVGKHVYLDPESTPENPIYKEAYGVNSETIVGKFIFGENIGIYNDAGTMRFDGDGFVVKNGDTKVEIVPESEDIFKITTSSGVVFLMKSNGNLTITGDVNAHSFSSGNKTSTDGAEGLYIDNKGNLSSGTSNQIQLNADGTFSLGGSNGIVFDGSKIYLGSQVIMNDSTQSLKEEITSLKNEIEQLKNS